MSKVHLVMTVVEWAGIAVILAGILFSLAAFLHALVVRSGTAGAAYGSLRRRLGRSILLGLELLVAADIIGTVALEPTLRSVAVLGGIVVIRTFLSFALEVEIEGRWPWRRHASA